MDTLMAAKIARIVVWVWLACSLAGCLILGLQRRSLVSTVASCAWFDPTTKCGSQERPYVWLALAIALVVILVWAVLWTIVQYVLYRSTTEPGEGR